MWRFWAVCWICCYLQFNAFSEAKDLDPLVERTVKASDRSLLDYISLVEQISKIKNDPNSLRSSNDMKRFNKQFHGRRFVFKDRITVKSNYLVSGERALWAMPMKNLDAKVILSKEQNDLFLSIEEYDFMRGVVELISVKDRIIQFRLIEATDQDIYPYDPFANKSQFENYNKQVKRLEKQKKLMRYSKYKKFSKKFTQDHYAKLGYITGVIRELKYENSEVIMEMDCRDPDQIKMEDAESRVYHKDQPFKVLIRCLMRYSNDLERLEIESEVTMAVLLERIDAKGVMHFFRGCRIAFSGE